MENEDAALHPIIYVRGYAMSQGEIDEATSDPFSGFNLGSTVFRATAERYRPPRKFIFESPLIRLISDFGYTDVFTEGRDILDNEWSGCIPKKSIIIYRYYDSASTLLGAGTTPSVEEFASGLGDLIIRVRDLVCGDSNNQTTAETFRCYLVGHSMGGLVCRALIQNPALDKANARQYVDKIFTYATPHNGIEVANINVPTWLSANDASNFNRARMAKFLNLEELYQKTKRVDWLPEEFFPSEKFFCLIGTNRSDYEVARGASRTFVGDGSDGLVKIENATVCGVKEDGTLSATTAKAFVYRSHSGYYGIVNSEESYQNLTRFLFGDVRVDIWLDIGEIRLPADVQKHADEGKEINALYQLEILASPRGKLWYLTRRTAEEDSVACFTHKEWMAEKKVCGLYVSSVFLANRARVNKGRPSLAYSMTLGVRVPDYEVDRKLWVNEHYEGGYLFRDSVVVEMVPPQQEGEDWIVNYDWQSDQVGQATTPLPTTTLKNGKVELPIEFDSLTTPGIEGKLRFIVSQWNA